MHANQPNDKTPCRSAYGTDPDAGTVLPHTIDKLIAPLGLLLRQMIVPVRLRSTDRPIDELYT